MPDDNKDDNKDKKTDDQKPDLAKQYADLEAKHNALNEKLEKLLASKTKDDEELIDKSKRERAEKDKQDGDAKALEAALRFNMNSDSFLKSNESLLPKDIADIFKTAEKEKFDNPIEKDRAVKAGIIQSFFSVQSNLDLLTPALKNQLEDYLKLTKNGKQEKAQGIFDAIFEPTFEMLRRVKKAEALNKGHGDNSNDAYKNKLIAISKNRFLGEKQNA